MKPLAPADAKLLEGHGLVLFDGVCNFCNASVNFIIDRDRPDYFRFAPLQSDLAARLLAADGREVNQVEPDSVLLFENGALTDRSTAALRIAKRLSGPWFLFFGFVVVPRVIRDFVYKWVARNRYRWFGKSDACRVPTPALKARFVATA